MSYEKKLMQMKGLVKKNLQKEQPIEVVSSNEVPFYLDAWKNAGLNPIQNEHGLFFVKETFYSEHHIHGNIALKKLSSAIEHMHKNYPNHPLTINLNSPFTFYDTETTGLKGTGVLIFLNGLLKKVDQGFLLRQFVLADPSHEAAFLFATDFWRDIQTVITYNGKSFDLPQLQTRWTMNRNVLPKLVQHEQIDLMHSSKRIWKGELERFKLKQVEEQKLGFVRKDDIPGHLAPIIYFDAVKSGNPTNLMKVLKHNEWDILSLVTLYILSVDLLKEDEAMESALTYTNIGKWFKDLKTKEASFEWFQFVVNHFSNEDACLAYYYVGLHLKRNQLFDESIHAFQKSLKEIAGKYRVKVYIELAKLYEHQMKNYEIALEITLQCTVYMEKIEGEMSPLELLRLKQDLEKRKERITRKLNISRESAQVNKKRVVLP